MCFVVLWDTVRRAYNAHAHIRKQVRSTDTACYAADHDNGNKKLGRIRGFILGDFFFPSSLVLVLLFFCRSSSSSSSSSVSFCGTSVSFSYLVLVLPSTISYVCISPGGEREREHQRETDLYVLYCLAVPFGLFTPPPPLVRRENENEMRGPNCRP